MALVIIDLQKAFRNPENEGSMKRACECIEAAIPLFRKAGLPVVWVQHIAPDDGAEPGKEGFDFIGPLLPEAGDFRVEKRYGNAFNKTDLFEFVKAEKVSTLLLAGYCAEYCVLSTYRGAKDHDLTPILLRDSLASENAEHIRFVEEICDIASLNAVRKMLEPVV
jgi:nicotinamidase-related amidase